MPIQGFLRQLYRDMVSRETRQKIKDVTGIKGASPLSGSLGYDTPTFSYYDPFESQAADTAGNSDQSTNDTPPSPTRTTTDTSGTDTKTAADEAAYWQNQIDAINRLLGTYQPKLDQGLEDIGANYGMQKTNLANEKLKTMNTYNSQLTQNAQDKQAGVEGVDNFVNTSFKNLMRLLGGAGAGNSSVARTVVPTLVSQAGSTRRQGVFKTAGENERDINSAITDAENDYQNEGVNIEDWRNAQEKSLREGVTNSLLELLGKKSTYETQKASATGANYQQALDAAASR